MADQDESTLYYRSVDKAGNVETTKSATYMIDSEGPRCRAKSTSVKRGKTATFRYYVADDRSDFVSARIRIQDMRGRIPITSPIPPDLTMTASANEWEWWMYVVNFKKGTYQIVVTAKDEAGNQQSQAGYATVVVK
jgi:hypothetical protein